MYLHGIRDITLYSLSGYSPILLSPFLTLSYVTSSSPSAMSSTKLSAFEAGIVDACAKHEQAHWNENDYRACVSLDPDHFVKFDIPQVVWPEIASHSHIFEYAQSHADTPGTPRIPKVIHHFEYQHTMYMVMEAITLMEPPPDLPERIAEAVRWLSGVPAPADHVLGPLGGGVIRHSFFKDYEAPLVFSSIEALERYIEQVRPCLYSLEHPLTSSLGQARTVMSSELAKKRMGYVGLSGERLMFMQPDMDPGNFGVDERGNTVLMDFGEIAMLPESFAAFTLSNHHAALATSLGLSSSSNAASMTRISSFLWMVYDPTLGAPTCTWYGISTNVRYRPGQRRLSQDVHPQTPDEMNGLRLISKLNLVSKRLYLL